MAVFASAEIKPKVFLRLSSVEISVSTAIMPSMISLNTLSYAGTKASFITVYRNSSFTVIIAFGAYISTYI